MLDQKIQHKLPTGMNNLFIEHLTAIDFATRLIAGVVKVG